MRRSEREPPRPPGHLQVGLMFIAFALVFGALLFVPAGRLDWTAGWVYLTIFIAATLVNYLHVQRKNPTLIGYRMRIGPGTKTWDKAWMVLAAPLFAAAYIVAGLDAGRAVASAVPPVAWLVGLALFLGGSVLLTWSMGVNPYFEKTVRIQRERGHRVIDSGPYRYVRHPGYVGLVGWTLSAPLMLGSRWALIPATLAVAATVLRTALEDRTLRDELPGYRDYAARVRYRLIPGVW